MARARAGGVNGDVESDRGRSADRPGRGRWSRPYQFFGRGRIDRRTRALTMKLFNVNGEIYSVELPPAG
jgi:hypothetical protein